MSSDDDQKVLPTSVHPGQDGPLWFDAGIYKNEGFILFEFGLVEVQRAYMGNMVIQVTLFHLWIGYLHIDFGWNRRW